MAAKAAMSRNIDRVFLFRGRHQRPDFQDLLLGRVGEPAEHEAGNADDNQHDTHDGQGLQSRLLLTVQQMQGRAERAGKLECGEISLWRGGD